MKALNVAVLGCGSVGSQVVRLLTEQADDLAARVGAPVQLVGVAVRRIDAPREVEVPRRVLDAQLRPGVRPDDGERASVTGADRVGGRASGRLRPVG